MNTKKSYYDEQILTTANCYIFDPIDWEEGADSCEGKEEKFLQKIEDLDQALEKVARNLYVSLLKEDLRPVRSQARALSSALT